MRPATDQARPVAATGQDDRLIPPSGSATARIVNMRWDPRGWWVNDRGWEPLLVRDDDHRYAESDLAPIRFLRFYTRHQGAEVYPLYEQDRTLQFDYGNDNGETVDSAVELSTDRHIPKPDDPGTILAPYGRFALLLNGYDGPLKFWGADLTTPFGFTAPPPPPVILGINPGIRDDAFAADGNTGSADNACAIGRLGVSPPFPGNLAGTNSYAYRMSWVSETGSESPLSEESVLSWAIPSPTSLLNVSTFAPYLASVSRGPENTRARRIYRTKNLGDQAGLVDRTLYFLAEIPDNTTDAFVDVLADARLTVLAPDLADSVPLPPGLRFAATFDGRFWLAGGAHCETRLIYSNVDAPEQFAALSFYELGSQEAGAITALVAQEGRLYVFRERGIDEITVNQFDATYSQRSVSTLVGTTATNTIRAVPGFGLVFLTRDGVYALLAGKLSRLSDPISDEMSRIGAGPLARASAAWSSREAEYWVVYPADGAVENTRGAVLHAAISTPDRPAWSLRHVTGTDGTSVYRAIVTAIDTDPEGWFVFGVAPVDLTTGDYPGTSLLSTLQVAAAGPPPVVASVLANIGLQVWSARPSAGSSYTVTDAQTVGDDIGFVATSGDAGKLESLYQSAWIQFDTRTRVFSVEVWLLNTGKPDITFEFASDGREEWTDAGITVEASPYETHGTRSADHVYASDADASRRGYQATWGTSKWREDRVVRVRFDVAPDVGAVGSFAFRLRFADLVGILGYRVNSAALPIRTGAQGQPAGGA